MKKLIDGHKQIINKISLNTRSEERRLKKEYDSAVAELKKQYSDEILFEKKKIDEVYDKKLREDSIRLESSFDLKKKELELDFKNIIINKCYEDIINEVKKFSSAKKKSIISNMKDKLLEEIKADNDQAKSILIPKNITLPKCKSELKDFEVVIKSKSGAIYKDSLRTVLDKNEQEVMNIIKHDLLE